MTKPITQKQFGETIRKARMASGISLREAAKQMGISAAYLSSLECNTDGYTPDDEVIRKIASVIKIEYKELRDLSKDIDGFNSFRKKLSPDDASNIKALYKKARDKGISTGRALELFKNAIQGDNGTKAK
jgi:transcriptional regulator with XRE-family HTH domain